MPRSKFGNIKCSQDGYVFDSKWERERYIELSLLEKAGLITSLKVHPEYVLMDASPKLYISEQETLPALRKITYTPDFEYVDETGRLITEDTKGWIAEVSRIKMKLFMNKYGRSVYVLRDPKRRSLKRRR